MPPLNPAKLLEYIRILLLAAAEMRIDAREVAGYTEEQLDALIERLDSEWDAAIEEGKRLSGQ